MEKGEERQVAEATQSGLIKDEFGDILFFFCGKLLSRLRARRQINRQKVTSSSTIPALFLVMTGRKLREFEDSR